MQYRTGDIILVKNQTIVGKLIRLFMIIENILRFRFQFNVYNHVAIVSSSSTYAEADLGGVVYSPLYKLKRYVCSIHRPNTVLDYNNIRACITKYNARPYGKSDIFFHLIRIFTGVWLGRTHSKASKKLHCSEHVALILHLNTNTSFRWWKASPNTIQRYCIKHCTKIV